MQTQHILQGIDPAVVHMAIKCPKRAPVHLKALIAMASKRVISGNRPVALPLDMLLEQMRVLARDSGYDLLFTVENPEDETAKYGFQQMKAIMEQVADKHKVSVHEIKSASRGRAIVIPRQEFFYRAKTETLKSYPDIGRFCGGRDHTTVLHGVRRHAAMFDKPMPVEKEGKAA